MVTGNETLRPECLFSADENEESRFLAVSGVVDKTQKFSKDRTGSRSDILADTGAFKICPDQR